MSTEQKIELLTDVAKTEVKNYYRHIFLVERKSNSYKLQFFSLQDEEGKEVDLDVAINIPVTLPSGGNPLHAQGIYPIPCYPMYERHINEFADVQKTSKMILDRLLKTVPYQAEDKDDLSVRAELIARLLNTKGMKYVTDERQLGILAVVDHDLPLFACTEGCKRFRDSLFKDEGIHIDKKILVENILEARFQEAKELGFERKAISTISNKETELAVSAYNKSWLWLSPTWEMPRSIYWKKSEWTKGIRLNKEEYAAFFFGTQFLKQVQTQLHASLVKEMFAPVHNAEAKKHMNPTSFEQIYGIPYVTPLLDQAPDNLFTTFNALRRYHGEEYSSTDLQLEIIAGLERRFLPDIRDNLRLSIVYYSGNLARGDIHIRAFIEDVVPSIAMKIQNIVKRLKRSLQDYANLLQLSTEQTKYTLFKISYLPSLLSNAYGPGYVWSIMNAVLHRREIELDRVTQKTNKRLTELANKGKFWDIRNELLFYHLFRMFYYQYYVNVIGMEEGNKQMEDWAPLLKRYLSADLKEEDFNNTEKIGFLSGCLIQQFERSYFAKTRKPFLETRIMRFGSKLTPEMIWKNGLLKSQELRKQWDLGIRKNYDVALAYILPAILKLNNSQLLAKEKDKYMTMFWSGYLMLPKVKEEETLDEN